MKKASKKKLDVTPSCGCVFCDVELEPIKLGPYYLHYMPREDVFVICDLKTKKTPKKGEFTIRFDEGALYDVDVVLKATEE